MTEKNLEVWRLLMVDDDEDDFFLTQIMLHQAQGRKIDLEWAATQIDGLARLESDGYDAVLVDYDLGTHTGINFIRTAIVNGYRAPFILFTGRGSYDVDLEAMQAGATLYLTKGETTPLLLERSIRYAIERKRIEQERLDMVLALAESENRWRQLAEAMPNLVWTCNAAGQCDYLSPKWAEFTGVPVETQLGYGWLERVHPDDRQAVMGEWMEMQATGRVHDVEFRLRGRDGSYCWFQANITRICDEQGRTLKWYGSNTEIQHHKDIEARLLQSQQELAHAQAVAHIGNWRLDVHKNELLWSDENYRIFGVPIGVPQTYDTFISLVHPDDRAFVDRKWQAALLGEPYDIEHRILVDGQVRWVRERAVLEFASDGRLNGGFGTTQDVTERRLVLDELRKSQAVLAQAGRMARLGAWSIEFDNLGDINANPLHWSDEVYRMFGYEPGEVQASNELFFQHVHPDDRQRIADSIANAIREGSVYHLEHRVIRRDGAERVVLEHAEITYDEAGRPLFIVGAVQDITEDKRKEEALQAYAEKLKSDRSISAEDTSFFGGK